MVKTPPVHAPLRRGQLERSACFGCYFPNLMLQRTSSSFAAPYVRVAVVSAGLYGFILKEMSSPFLTEIQKTLPGVWRGRMGGPGTLQAGRNTEAGRLSSGGDKRRLVSAAPLSRIHFLVFNISQTD